MRSVPFPAVVDPPAISRHLQFGRGTGAGEPPPAEDVGQFSLKLDPWRGSAELSHLYCFVLYPAPLWWKISWLTRGSLV